MPTFVRPKKTDVIVHPMEAPDETYRGIIKSRAHKKMITQGIIVALGEEAEEVGLEIGLHVIFNPYAGSHIAVEDTGLLYVFHHAHVEAILENTGAKLMSTDTIKRLISDRITETLQKMIGSVYEDGYRYLLPQLEKDLHERIDDYAVSEGFQWGF